MVSVAATNPDGDQAMNRNQEIAQTILSQIGGQRRLVLMTGAKHFVAIESGLQFKIGGGAKDGINCVRITLTPMDEYKVEFIRTRGMKATPVATHDGAHAEDLVTLFQKETGFTLAIPRIRGINA
jgi:hypothetical protein